MVLDDYQALMAYIRECWPEIKGTDAQVAALIADALETVSPDTDAAAEDAQMLAQQFQFFAGHLGGDTEYPEEIQES